MTPDELRKARIGPPPPSIAKVRFPICDESRMTGDGWTHLGKPRYRNRFFSSPHARLTPISGSFPCLYLAADAETSVAEIWGDRLRLAADSGRKIYAIRKGEADEYQYFRPSLKITSRGFLVHTAPRMPPLKLCDLTDGDTLLALGLDLATLHTPDTAIPRAWADALAQHSTKIDGLVYPSRHTNRDCVVIWARSTTAKRMPNMLLDPDKPFRESDPAYALASKIGIKLSFLK